MSAVSVRPLALSGLSGLLAIAVLALGTGCEKEQPQMKQQALPVDIFVVKTADVPVVSHLTGRANPRRKAEVRPQVNGILQKRLFIEGSTVEAGQQLYQIDASVYEASLASARASLSSARATEHSTKLRSQRYTQLLSQKAVSTQDYDDAEAAYLAAHAAVESAMASVRTAEINLAYTKVYAPISGTIGKSEVTEGALVSAQQSTALTTIQQLDPIYVDFGETVEEHLQLRRNFQSGQLLLNDGGKPVVDIFFNNGEKYAHQGVVEFADVSVDASTGMVNLRALVPNPDHILLPSMFLRGDIHQGMTPNAVVIAAQGVQREAGGVTYAYVVDEQNTVQRRNIRIGTNYQSYYLVQEGLQPGERVVISNTQKIRPGMPVIPIDASAAPQSGSAPEGAAAPGEQAAPGSAPEAAPAKDGGAAG